MRLQPVPPEQFAKYKEALSGLNETNAHLITTKLIEMGLQPGAGIAIPPEDTRMIEMNDPDLKRLRDAAI